MRLSIAQIRKPWLCKRVMALDANEWAARFGSKDSGDENGVAHARTADVEPRDCFESSLKSRNATL